MAARIAAMAFVMLAIAVTAVQIKHGDPKPAAPSSSSTVIVDGDPLRAELSRCQLLGEAGAHDAGCLRAWAENRRRFLRLGAQPSERSPVQMFPNPPPNGAPGTVSADQPKSEDK
ncbi:putative entry exclusion protein TrbK-alt [Methylocapsa acidiphila]|uniref:putative entry exclusion protein TrbK-alt n=1 Tax=Methylocapsa acidiphila TaxID=133552 RepID=UPI001FD97EF5|nr:putative entry exclusion protein TrbK-alt [Methylocapsa acidiphila]